MSLLPDYSNQARTYDSTRAASPSVLAPLAAALAGAPGGRLADIGGGTGNYAIALQQQGWQVTVIDRSEGMLAQAASKGLQTLRADAQSLPIGSESFDGAMLVSMLHHVENPVAALAEARRILRPGGCLAVMVFAREDIEELWCLEYFPSARAWMLESHMPLARLLENLPGARRLPIVYKDLQDASMAALLGHPELLLQRGWREQTSFFERLERDHPEELAQGLERLAGELQRGSAPREAGGASMIAWRKPSDYQR